MVFEVLGEVDRRHPTATKFTLDGVAVGQGGFEPTRPLGLRYWQGYGLVWCRPRDPREQPSATILHPRVSIEEAIPSPASKKTELQLMRRLILTSITALALGAFANSVSAQSLTNQIGAVQDGVVRFSFETRPEVCGDGRSIGEQTGTGFTTYTFWSGGYSTQSYKFWQPDCRRGPMRLVVEKADGRVRQLQAAVGVDWRPEAAGTDLGIFTGAEAADWLLDLAAHEGDVGTVAFLAANAAREAPIADRLVAMAKNRDLDGEVRERAVRWLNRAASREGQEANADRTLRSIALASTDNVDVRERAVRSLRATEANDAWLREQYVQIGSPRIRERVIRRLGESSTRQNVDWIRAIALDSSERTELRERALRVLGDKLMGADEIRGLYSRLDRTELKERALRLVGQTGSGESMLWVRQIAANANEPLEVRDRALRVMGEGVDVTTLGILYTELNTRELKDRVLRMVGEHESDEARAWLTQTALDRNQPNELRDRALRILGNHGDMSVRELFHDLESDELRDRVLRIAGNWKDAGTAEWLKGVATNPQYSPGLRDRALRSLAEQAIRTIELAALYEEVSSTDLRRRVIRILAERDDDVAVEKLRSIAETDPNRDLRRYATRRLAKMRHPDAEQHFPT